jgi:hypothetical protein
MVIWMVPLALSPRVEGINETPMAAIHNTTGTERATTPGA